MSKKKLVRLTRIKKSDYYDLIAEIKAEMDKSLIAPQIPPERLSKIVSHSIFTSADDPIPDCLTCGVCCAFALCVSVKNDDPTPPENYWELTMDDSASEIVVNKSLKRTTSKCNFLGGKLRENVACQIYEVRPQACRAF